MTALDQGGREPMPKEQWSLLDRVAAIIDPAVYRHYPGADIFAPGHPLKGLEQGSGLVIRRAEPREKAEKIIELVRAGGNDQ